MPEPRQPNILVVFTDQQRWDTCGCYGQSLPLTPHLDAMAAEGVRFSNAFSNQPLCGPVRALLQTGRYATETGCFRNHIALREGEDTLARRMRAAGYEAGYLGKWHLASTNEQATQLLRDRPFAHHTTTAVPPAYRGGYDDDWLAADALEHTSHGEGGFMFDAEGNRVDFSGYRVECQTDFALEYLRSRTGEKPFFLFLSYLEPHHQNDRDRYEGPEGSKERWKDFPVPGDLDGTEGNWREEYPDYLGCVNALDTALGRIRAELERLGLAENTLILFTSDHGCHFRTRNREYKRSCHDGSIRIPLVACGPGFRGGHVSDAMTSLIDVPTTLLAAAGVKRPVGWRGRALQEAVESVPGDWPEEVFVQISESHVGRALRTRDWTYAVEAVGKDGWTVASADAYTESHLYDNRNDPHQRVNLVCDPAYAGVRESLRARMEAWLREVELPATIAPAPAS